MTMRFSRGVKCGIFLLRNISASITIWQTHTQPQRQPLTSSCISPNHPFHSVFALLYDVINFNNGPHVCDCVCGFRSFFFGNSWRQTNRKRMPREFQLLNRGKTDSCTDHSPGSRSFVVSTFFFECATAWHDGIEQRDLKVSLSVSSFCVKIFFPFFDSFWRRKSNAQYSDSRGVSATLLRYMLMSQKKGGKDSNSSSHPFMMFLSAYLLILERASSSCHAMLSSLIIIVDDVVITQHTIQWRLKLLKKRRKQMRRKRNQFRALLLTRRRKIIVDVEVFCEPVFAFNGF